MLNTGREAQETVDLIARPPFELSAERDQNAVLAVINEVRGAMVADGGDHRRVTRAISSTMA